VGAPVGLILFAAVLAAYAYAILRTEYAGRFVAWVFVGAGLITFAYFFPVWVSMPISHAGYYARMWIQQSGLRSWI
jgi:dolichyl-phosphate-mannose--protein O-mannosyl transferase